LSQRAFFAGRRERAHPAVVALNACYARGPNSSGKASDRPDPDRPGLPERGPVADRARRAGALEASRRTAAGAARLRFGSVAARRAVAEARAAAGRARATDCRPARAADAAARARTPLPDLSGRAEPRRRHLRRRPRG